MSVAYALPTMDDEVRPDLLNVLIVDDERAIREGCREVAESLGFTTLTAENAATAYRQLESRSIDIVLLDMKMGDVNGDKVLGQLLARWPALCVIIVTGYPSLEDMRATFKLKVFDYLAKPFSLAQLRQVLKNAIEAFGLGRPSQDRLRERLGHRIKMLRVERDWSLKDLAAQTRLSVSQISAIERGTNLPSIESLLSISKAFDKKPSEILAAIDF